MIQRRGHYCRRAFNKTCTTEMVQNYYNVTIVSVFREISFRIKLFRLTFVGSVIL